MSNSKTRVNYDDLNLISRQFHQNGEEISHLQSITQRKVNALCSEWQGVAANAFYIEMVGRLLPNLQRVSEALMESETVLNKIMQVIREADVETSTYFKDLGGRLSAQPRYKWDWQKFVGGILGVPLVGGPWLDAASGLWGFHMDLAKGNNWGHAIFTELFKFGADKLITLEFPPYIIYPAVISWLHLVSGQSALTGGAVPDPYAQTIFNIAKFYDPSLTNADEAGWFQNTAETLDVREEVADGAYGIGKFLVENAKINGLFFYIDVGFGSPFSPLLNSPQQMPVSM